MSKPASSTGGSESKFADDLNVFKEFDRQAPLEQVVGDLETCRKRTHKWGVANRVTFDAGKEHLIILHPSEHHGEMFKLLGCPMDTDLRMHSAIEQLLSKIRPKITAILRTRAYYNVSSLISQFKTHIWGLIEAHSGGMFHTAASLLQKIDDAQSSFLHQLQMTSEQAFLEFNFAPPSLRRNIGILGLLHKRALGKCHPSFERLLPFLADKVSQTLGSGHNKQLYGHWDVISSHQALFNRSIFAMVDIYNCLPQRIIDCTSVTAFQKELTQVARRRCKDGNAAWAASYSRRCAGLEAEDT